MNVCAMFDSSLVSSPGSVMHLMNLANTGWYMMIGGPSSWGAAIVHRDYVYARSAVRDGPQ